MFLNQTLHTRLSLLYPDPGTHVRNKQSDQVKQHDKHAKTRVYPVGKEVMAQNFRQTGPKWMPGIILKQTGPLSYLVKMNSGLEWR